MVRHRSPNPTKDTYKQHKIITKIVTPSIRFINQKAFVTMIYSMQCCFDIPQHQRAPKLKKTNKCLKLTLITFFNKLISTIQFMKLFWNDSSSFKGIRDSVKKLKYNSIHITCLKVYRDLLGDNFG